MNEKEIFQTAADLSVEERAAYLAEACGEDRALRSRVDRLLDLHDQQTGFMAVPAAEAAVGEAVGEQPGSVIGPYTLIEVLGEGGMGIVFRARQVEPVARDVALKVVKPGLDTREVISRFRAEQQALAVMNHPNVAKVLDAGTTEKGRPFFVMELVEGVPITQFCDQQRMNNQQRLPLFIDVCQAIQHAHSKSIIHRDIKPTNVLVTVEGGKPIPKVIDFGVAKAIDQSDLNRSMITRFSQVVGTPLYMSPEQADPGGIDIDTRTDVYSLGVLLYELLTGTTPFDRQRLLQAAYAEVQRIIREEEPVKPSTRISTLGEAATGASRVRQTDPSRLRQRLRGDLDCIVMKAMEKDRTRRYETASSFAEDIQRFLNHEAVSASPPSNLYRFQRLLVRHRAAFAAASVMLMLLILGIVGTSWGWVRATQANHALALSLENEETQRLEAERQREVAQAVNAFLNDDLLAAAAPSSQPGRGHDVTMREVLDEAAKRIDEASQPGGRFGDKPLVEANIRYVMGRTFQLLGLPAVALPHLERAEALQQKQTPSGEALRLRIMETTSNALHDLGQREPAERMRRELIEANAQLHGADSEPTLIAMNNLATSHTAHGRFEDARALFQEVAERRKRTLGPGDPKTLTTQSNLANSYMKLGKFDEASTLLLEVLPVARESGDQATLGVILLNLGEACTAQADLDAAEQYVTEAIEVWSDLYGPDHPKAVGVKGYLGILASRQGKWQAAYDNLSEVFAATERRLGPTSAQTVSSKLNLSSALVYLERLDDAEQLLETNLDDAIEAQGNDNIWIRRTFSMIAWLGDAYDEEGREDDALRVRTRTLAHLVALADTESPTASDLHAAAVALGESPHETLRDRPRALEYARQAVKAEEAAGGERLDEYRETVQRLTP